MQRARWGSLAVRWATKKLAWAAILMTGGVAVPGVAAAQGAECGSPSYPCDELSFCTPCDLDPGRHFPATYTGNEDDDVAPKFTRSPGGEHGAYSIMTRFLALLGDFDYGEDLSDYGIPQSQIDQWADDWADGFEQDELPNALESTAFDRHTQPAFPAPPADGVDIPVDQGAPRSPEPTGTPNNNPGAAENADPVNPANGELYIERVDLAFPGFGVAFAHGRTYRSRISYSGVLGPGWDFSYNRRLLNAPDSRRQIESPSPGIAEIAYASTGLLPHAEFGLLGDPRGAPSAGCGPQVLYMTGRGTILRFRQVGETASQIYYESAEGVRLVLRGHKRQDAITWSLTSPDGIVEKFDELGLLQAIQDPTGVGLAMEWEPAGDDWQLAFVTDSVGRVIAYEYNPGGRLRRVVDETSELEASYNYAAGQLSRAVDSTGRAEGYEYDLDETREGGDWGPEGYLVPACELACAPSGSSCDAGGACDEPVRQASDQCMVSCGECGSSCILNQCTICESRCSVLLTCHGLAHPASTYHRLTTISYNSPRPRAWADSPPIARAGSQARSPPMCCSYRAVAQAGSTRDRRARGSA